MHITTRQATRDDIPALSRLLGTLFAQEAEFTPDYSAQARGLASIIDHPVVGHILLAERNKRTVGMVNVLYTISTALGEPVALFEDIVVDPKLRGQGIGSQLMEQAIAFAHSKGCRRITLLLDADNDSAKKFYLSHGFSHSNMVTMRLLLNN